MSDDHTTTAFDHPVEVSDRDLLLERGKEIARLIATNSELHQKLIEMASIKVFLGELAVLHKLCGELAAEVVALVDAQPVAVVNGDSATGQLLRKLKQNAQFVSLQMRTVLPSVVAAAKK